jgi:hypothetical protein
VLGHLLIMAVEAGPVGEFDFGDIAKAFLNADNILYNGDYQAILRTVFDERGILAAADADTYLEQLASLPDLSLPQSINHALSASIFLEQSVLPALKLNPEQELLPMATYRNSDGYAFMTYFSSRSIQLTGSPYGKVDGFMVDVFGGLTLVFDRSDKLRSAFYRPATDIDVWQIRIIIADMIQHNQIVNDLYPANARLKPNPKGLLIPDGAIILADETPGKLVKYPTIFDEIPERLSDIVDYLRSWIRQSDT